MDTIRIIDTVIQIDTVFRDTIPILLTNETVKTCWDYVKDYSFIITLLLGVLIGFGVDKLKEEIKFKKTRRYFFFSLKELKIAIETQIVLHKKHLEYYSKEDNYIPSLTFCMSFSTKSVNVVSYEDLFKIFVLKEKDKIKIPMLLNAFSKIDSILELHPRDSIEIKSIYERTIRRFSAELDKLLTEIDAFIKDENFFEPENPLHEFASEVKQLVEQFESKRKPNEDVPILRIMNELISDLNKIMLKYQSPKFQSSLFQVIHAFTEFKDNREKIGNIIKYDCESLIYIKNNFELVLTEYKKYLED